MRFVRQFARVLLDVDTSDPAVVQRAVGIIIHGAGLAHGQVELRDLIGLGQVGIEVVFAVGLAETVDFTAKGRAHAHAGIHDRSVQHGQDAGKAHANRAAVGVRLRPELVFAGAEYFRFGVQFRVDLQTHDKLILSHARSPPRTAAGTPIFISVCRS